MPAPQTLNLQFSARLGYRQPPPVGVCVWFGPIHRQSFVRAVRLRSKEQLMVRHSKISFGLSLKARMNCTYICQALKKKEGDTVNIFLEERV